MIRTDGFERYNSWGHSASLRTLYRQRCQRAAPEMTCAAQAAELLMPLAKPGQTILDAGCGSGHFFHSLKDRSIALDYFGIDATTSLIEIGQEELPSYGLPPEHLKVARIEDLNGSADFVLCMNVLTYLDNFHTPLARLLNIAKTGVILRESISDTAEYSFIQDTQLDPGVTLSVHINTYKRTTLLDFIRSRGFDVQEFQDMRSDGQPEFFFGRPHHWTFLLATRRHQQNG